MDDKYKISKKVISLKYFLDNDIELWEELKENFSCPRNLDIERFLKHSSKRFEDSHNSRTYLIFDENNMSLGILAYFSLTFKEIELEQQITGEPAKRLDGISKKIDIVKGYLVGQLGKNDIPNNPIKLPDIFEEVYPIIKKIQILLGGRLVFLECDDNVKLIKLYEDNGYRVLQKETREKKDRKSDEVIESNIFVQMFRVINT